MIRSISVNPVGRVWVDIGTPEPFEVPFWNGDHPAEDDYPLPFPCYAHVAAALTWLAEHLRGWLAPAEAKSDIGPLASSGSGAVLQMPMPAINCAGPLLR